MAMTMRNVGVGLSVLLAFFLAECYIFMSNLADDTRAVIFRAHLVVIIESVVMVLSIFVWKRFSSIFDTSIHIAGETESTSSTTTTLYTSDFHSENGSLQSKGSFKSKKTRLSGTALVWRIFIVCYLFLCHISYICNLFFIGTEPARISMVSYICLGSFVHLITGFIIISCVKCVVNMTNIGHSRTTRFWRVVTLSYCIAMSTVGVYNGSRLPIVKTVEIPVRDLPIAFEGLSIAQLSDIHLGPTVGRSKLEEVVKLTNDLQADVTVLTGDLVDGSVSLLSQAAQPLSGLHSKYGLYYVTGNHEYYTGDVDNWFDYIRTLGFTVLHNENRKITPLDRSQPGEICLAGTDDIVAARIGYSDHGMDLKSALRSCDPNFPTILLAHQPIAAQWAFLSDYRVDLVLSGHTHGGQMFPLMLGAYFLNPFFAGLYKYGTESHVYVSMGTVYWGIPMRVFSSREITKIILTKL